MRSEMKQSMWESAEDYRDRLFWKLADEGRELSRCLRALRAARHAVESIDYLGESTPGEIVVERLIRLSDAESSYREKLVKVELLTRAYEKAEVGNGSDVPGV